MIGIIYKIVCNTNNLTYYGSTISSLKERLRCHIKSKKTCSVHKILENNNYQILLVENYECDNKKELLLISSNINKKILYFQRKQFLISLLYILPIFIMIISYIVIIS